MSIKNLLVPLFESPDDAHAILNAVEVAAPFGAHVTAMFSGGHLSELVAATPPHHGRVKPHLQIEARTLLAEQTEQARRSFESLASEHKLVVSETPGSPAGVTVSFEARRGQMEATIQEAAVFHDLVVFCRDADSAASTWHGLSTLKSALQSCGRPLLILPRRLPRPFASNIAIAWNGSIEGAHAVSAAMPMLTLAKEVHIHTVGAETDPAQKLRRYLGWHGIQCELHTWGQNGDDVGAVLLSAVHTAQSDLLVLGGYTHSRIRESILGGVTHHVVRHAQVPVLLSR